MSSVNGVENKADKCSGSDNVHYDNSYPVAGCDPAGKIAKLGYRTFVSCTAITFTGLDYSSRIDYSLTHAQPSTDPHARHTSQPGRTARHCRRK